MPENCNINGYVSSWTYVALRGGTENYTTLGVSYKNGCFGASAGAGASTSFSMDSCKVLPTVEGKVKCDFGKGFTGQVRGRGFLGKNPVFQVRGTVSKDFETGVKGLSPYVATHITDNMCQGNHAVKAGGWVGVAYKIDKHWTVASELQQNIPINSTFDFKDNCNRLVNVGVTYTF